jgi:magnesium-transporting ATPase (P-type)
MSEGTIRSDAGIPGIGEAPGSWHDRSADEVMEILGSRETGLGGEEARRRLDRFGPNRLPAPPRRHPVLRFLAQFNNSLIYFLLAAAAASWLLGHVVDAAVIIAVVLINAVVGSVQEGKAEKALEAIGDMIAPHANVVRDGRRQGVAVPDLVPGDLVLLEAGDRVPADLRLVRARSLLIDEAVLTGESVAAEKHEERVAADSQLGDRSSMAFSGTMVAAGQGMGVAVATGRATEIGRISTLIGEVRSLTTPLLRQINQFGRLLTWVVFGIAALLFAFAVLMRGYGWVDAMMVVVAIAVGLIPEGLPAVITITLAIGVQRMASRNAIVRRLPAVEALGATTVICSDKTGTLTRNEMTVRRAVTPAAAFLVEGAGYRPEGAISLDRDASPGGEGEADAPGLRRLAEIAALCNDSRLSHKDGNWTVEGDPMEGALVVLAMKAGLDPEALRGEWRRADEIPFDAAHRFMATLHRHPGGQGIVMVKGAPERILSMCSAQMAGEGGAPLDRAYWEAAISSATGRGERVLGFAFRRHDGGQERLSFERVGEGLVFAGIVGFIDPPRDEAVAAIADCRSAGIAVKMITGDHARTAAAIARQLRIADDPQAVTGAELAEVADADLPDLASRTSVFARTSPEHKLRIVRALQSRGEIVAMTGDGVNDAPSLKQADVGVAMGRKGTEAAKEAAQMVLVDDNFASIVAAVREGRTVYDNIRKVIAWTLPTNGGEALAVILALVLGAQLPLTPVQILWINMITAITLGLVLAFEPAEPGIMGRPPRMPGAPILSRFLLWRVALVSCLFTAGVYGIFGYALNRGLGLDAARTMAVNTIVVMEIFYLFNVRYLHSTSFSFRGLLGTPALVVALGAVVAAQMAFTYLPVFQVLFSSVAIQFLDGVVVVAIGVALLFVLEAEKAIMRKLGFLSGTDM